MNNKRITIRVQGPLGAGKTTTAIMLKKYLESRGGIVTMQNAIKSDPKWAFEEAEKSIDETSPGTIADIFIGRNFRIIG
jgi:ABC-type branched-subunit amino acid transport system ATPase component